MSMEQELACYAYCDIYYLNIVIKYGWKTYKKCGKQKLITYHDELIILWWALKDLNLSPPQRQCGALAK